MLTLPGVAAQHGSADDESVTVRPLLSAFAARLRDQRGYTLTEMLTVLSIMLIVITTLAGVFVSGSNAEVDLANRFQAQSDARLALDGFRRETHNSCLASQSSTANVTLWSLDAAGSCTSKNTWCAVAVGAGYSLYRKAGTTCDATGRRWARHLTGNAVFTVVAPSSGKLPRVAVDITVDTKPADTLRRYRLQDQIALRNYLRS